MTTTLLNRATDVANCTPISRPSSTEDWHLFVPGPVPIAPHLRNIGNQQPPYNRTADFSETTQEILTGLEELFQTKGKVALLTASGTAAMEAAALNFLDTSDRVLVVNGGTFGQRWCDICDALAVPYDEITVPLGEDLDLDRLTETLSKGRYTALLINAHETSVGHLYDIAAVGELTQRHDVLLVVDAISSICADAFAMDAWGVDVAILSSHKALALPPGMSFVAMGQRALERLHKRGTPRSLYFDLKDYLANQERGQSPYTPAIGLMLQLQQRLLDIREQTLSALVEQHRQRAAWFRDAIVGSGFEVLPCHSSNAMTALTCGAHDASEVAEELRDHHRIIVATSGGALRSKVIRVAHMGAQNHSDVERLASALGAIGETSNKGNKL